MEELEFMSEKKQISIEYYNKRKAELNEILTVKIPENEEAIKEARGHGDLSENADYDAAKDEQARLDALRRQIEAELDNVEIIDESTINTSEAGLMTIIQLENLATNSTLEICLTSNLESDRNARPRKISIESPMGSAVAGKKVGDLVSVYAPSGKMEYKILSISKNLGK